MSKFLINSKLGLVFLGALLWTGCSNLQCYESLTDSSLVFTHSSGGLAPVISMLEVYDDGKIVYTNPNRKTRCREIPAAEAVALLAQVEQISSVAIEAGKEGEDYFDYEEYSFEVDGWDAYIPVEIMPDEVAELASELELLVREYFGKDFSPIP